MVIKVHYKNGEKEKFNNVEDFCTTITHFIIINEKLNQIPIKNVYKAIVDTEI